MDSDVLKTLPKKHGHNQIKICVSGAAETGHCGIDALDKAKELGCHMYLTKPVQLAELVKRVAECFPE